MPKNENVYKTNEFMSKNDEYVRYKSFTSVC